MTVKNQQRLLDKKWIGITIFPMFRPSETDSNLDPEFQAITDATIETHETETDPDEACMLGSVVYSLVLAAMFDVLNGRCSCSSGSHDVDSAPEVVSHAVKLFPTRDNIKKLKPIRVEPCLHPGDDELGERLLDYRAKVALNPSLILVPLEPQIQSLTVVVPAPEVFSSAPLSGSTACELNGASHDRGQDEEGDREAQAHARRDRGPASSVDQDGSGRRPLGPGDTLDRQEGQRPNALGRLHVAEAYPEVVDDREARSHRRGDNTLGESTPPDHRGGEDQVRETRRNRPCGEEVEREGFVQCTHPPREGKALDTSCDGKLETRRESPTVSEQPGDLSSFAGCDEQPP